MNNKRLTPTACCDFQLINSEREDMIEMFKALGNPIRFEIIKYLTIHPGCITADFVNALPIAQATTSQHLQVLKDAGWIVSSPQGAATCYYLNEKQIINFRQILNKMFKEL